MKKLATIPEIADLLGVSTQRAYEMARRGLIPAVRMGRQVRVDMESLNEWIRNGGSSHSDSTLPITATPVGKKISA